LILIIEKIKILEDSNSELVREAKIDDRGIVNHLKTYHHQTTEKCDTCEDNIGLDRIAIKDQDSNWSRILEEEERIRKKDLQTTLTTRQYPPTDTHTVGNKTPRNGGI
jgi:hypothetical protein